MGLIVDIALTLYEGLIEFSEKNKKLEKVTFTPRIDLIEVEEQSKYGENEIENLSNHRNEYHDLKEWKNEGNEVEHHGNESEELQELLEEENEILENLNNHRNNYDDEYYNLNDSVAVKLTLDTEADMVEGFIFDIIKQDIVERWKEEMFDLTNTTDEDVYGFNSDFPNIYTQSEAVFDAIQLNELGSSNMDPVAQRSLGEDGIILNEKTGEKYEEEPKRIISMEYDGEKFAKEAERKVLIENEIENSSEEQKTDLNRPKKRRRRRRRKPMFDRESGISPPKREQTLKVDEEIEAELQSFPLKQSRKKFRTKSGRHKRKRFPGKKSARRSQFKQTAFLLNVTLVPPLQTEISESTS